MLLLLLACVSTSKDPPPQDSPTPTDTTVDTQETEGQLGFRNPHLKNLVVIEVDTFRADHLSRYGYTRETMPLTMQRPWRTIDGLTSTSSWTPLATGSVMTGLEVHHHGLLAYAEAQVRFPITAPTLGQAFSAAGFRTGLFAGNIFVASSTGIGTGFSYEEVEMQRFAESNLGVLQKHALAWLDSGTGPFVMFLQPMDMHEPYSPEPQDRGVWAPAVVPFEEDSIHQVDELAQLWRDGDEASRAALTQVVTDIYDEQALGLDRSLDALLTGLEERGLLEDTLVVLTGDHGETLNDDGTGTFGHGTTLGPEAMQVPLLFLGSNIPEGNGYCGAMSSDVAPTLLDLMDLPPMENIDGQSMQKVCRSITRASLYTPDALWWISAATAQERLSRDCLHGIELSWDLRSESEPFKPVQEGSLPDTAALRDEISALYAEIQTSVPGSFCKP